MYNLKLLYFTQIVPDSSIPADSDEPAWKHLISRSLPPSEVVSLIGTIFASKDEVKMVFELRGNDAQTFIDVIHGVGLFRIPSIKRHDLITSELSNSTVRLSISLISRRATGRSAWVRYIGYAVAALYFREYSKSPFPTID